MTLGYNMKCKHIVHMHNPSDEAESIKEIEKVLDLVHHKCLTSVAFPLIGTGFYTYIFFEARFSILVSINKLRH